jgi:hypothetical protein
VTLRSQLGETEKKVESLTSNLIATEKKVIPLQEMVNDLQGEVEVRKAECLALTEDNQRWKGRTQQILQKYERIDPVEYGNLVKSVEVLKQERDALQVRIDELSSQHEATIKDKDERLTKINEVAKRYKDLSVSRAQLAASKDLMIQEKDNEISLLKDAAKPNELKELQEERDRLLSLRTEDKTKFKEIFDKAKKKAADLEVTIAEIKKEKDEVENLKKELEVRLEQKTLEGTLTNAERQKLLSQHAAALSEAELKIKSEYTSKITLMQGLLSRSKAENNALSVKIKEQQHKSSITTKVVEDSPTIIELESSKIFEGTPSPALSAKRSRGNQDVESELIMVSPDVSSKRVKINPAAAPFVPVAEIQETAEVTTKDQPGSGQLVTEPIQSDIAMTVAAERYINLNSSDTAVAATTQVSLLKVQLSKSSPMKHFSPVLPPANPAKVLSKPVPSTKDARAHGANVRKIPVQKIPVKPDGNATLPARPISAPELSVPPVAKVEVQEAQPVKIIPIVFTPTQPVPSPDPPAAATKEKNDKEMRMELLKMKLEKAKMEKKTAAVTPGASIPSAIEATTAGTPSASADVTPTPAAGRGKRLVRTGSIKSTPETGLATAILRGTTKKGLVRRASGEPGQGRGQTPIGKKGGQSPVGTPGSGRGKPVAKAAVPKTE